MPGIGTDVDSSGEWLSLQEASDRLGVATSTLRRWGDEGRVAMKRTLGGHRRFAAAQIESLVTQESQALTPVEPQVQQWGIDERELARQEWHAHFARRGDAERMRGLGQRLLGLLMQYINRRSDDTRFLEEARGVGRSYGGEAHETGVSLYDTVEAFLFFRSAFSRLALPIPGIAQPTDLDEAAVLHGRIDRFMDAVLLGLVDGYEQIKRQQRT